MRPTYFIGIDIGTQGARVVVLDQQGNQIGVKEESFRVDGNSREEQSPENWWNSCYRSLLALCNELVDSIDLTGVKAISVTSTSGTIIPLDRNNQPMHNAIMYCDPRSAPQAEICKQAALSSGYNGYSGFNSSSGLAKMIWFLENYPGKINSLWRFIHAADFIIGKLTGRFSITDPTNALKSGFDARKMEWPAYLFKKLPLQKKWMQEVRPSGSPIGTISGGLAKELGLPAQVIVTTGMTDGCASQIASGAVNPGDWNTTIGTTLVIKGVTRTEIIDPTGALYCHRHPNGYWMPGGASNTGADWVSKLYDPNDLTELNAIADSIIPTGNLAWPLLQAGERFPFVAPQARGFKPGGLDDKELFAAYMEGVAYIERYAYEKIKDLSGEQPQQIFTAGGASNSDTWLRIRSSVLSLPVRKMQNVSGATGAAILAASQTYFDSIMDAAGAIIKEEKLIMPEPGLIAAYDNSYHRFINLLLEKGYISSYEYA